MLEGMGLSFNCYLNGLYDVGGDRPAWREVSLVNVETKPRLRLQHPLQLASHKVLVLT
jgi:hypothetical protein